MRKRKYKRRRRAFLCWFETNVDFTKYMAGFSKQGNEKVQRGLSKIELNPFGKALNEGIFLPPK